MMIENMLSKDLVIRQSGGKESAYLSHTTDGLDFDYHIYHMRYPVFRVSTCDLTSFVSFPWESDAAPRYHPPLIPVSGPVYTLPYQS
jgi:hypothetical protein